MNIFKRLLLASGLLIGSVFTAQASSMQEILDASFKLYDGSGQGFCSATLIADDLLLTAAHCTDETGTNIRVQIKNDKYEVVKEVVVYTKAVRVLRDADIAILAPLDPSIKFSDVFGVHPVDVATPTDVDGNLKMGDQVFAVGYPLAWDLAVTEGLWGGKVAPIGDWKTEMYRFTAPIAPGNSGGGLYMLNGDEYELIGVNVGAVRGHDFINLADPITSVEAVTKGFALAAIKEQIAATPAPEDGRTDSK